MCGTSGDPDVWRSFSVVAEGSSTSIGLKRDTDVYLNRRVSKHQGALRGGHPYFHDTHTASRQRPLMVLPASLDLDPGTLPTGVQMEESCKQVENRS